MDLGLHNRVAIVTGSSRGLGKAAAVTLAAEGARVVLNARTQTSLEETAAEIRGAGGVVHSVVADVATETGCQLVFDRAVQTFGQVDILVNNAGGSPPARLMSPDSEWGGVLDWTFWSSLRLSRLVAPGMRECVCRDWLPITSRCWLF
jgi:NAD(P)-dependent dehydrogenase (short-subunit alcohol dehydrogenase family)